MQDCKKYYINEDYVLVIHNQFASDQSTRFHIT